MRQHDWSHRDIYIGFDQFPFKESCHFEIHIPSFENGNSQKWESSRRVHCKYVLKRQRLSGLWTLTQHLCMDPVPAPAFLESIPILPRRIKWILTPKNGPFASYQKCRELHNFLWVLHKNEFKNQTDDQQAQFAQTEQTVTDMNSPR